MLEFDAKTYQRIFELANKYNLLANCREYPPLSFTREQLHFSEIKEILQKNFNNQKFICGLYVHFPFCESRCLFCKYYSEVVSDKKTIFNKYINLLEKELFLYETPFLKTELDNLCLGGGTPTLLSEKQIEKYLGIIYRFFRFKPGAQISIEGTPETITRGKIKTYKNLGINRISLGLQSLNNEVLKKIGRRHTVKDVFRAFNIIRGEGIKYISADIMWGLPGESIVTYKKTINNIIKLSPEFIEGFLLTEGGRVKINRFYPPDININEIINWCKEKLVSNGYRVYSWGNFLGMIKKRAQETTAVNQNMDGLYNCRSAVFGIGAGASSHFNNLKYKIVSDFKTYLTYLQKNDPPIFYGRKLSQDDYKRQYIISRIGFFRSIEKGRYKKLFGRDLAVDFSREIAHLKNQGIIHETNNRYSWLLDEEEMGHEAFFRHVIQYWYHPNYIREILKRYEHLSTKK